LTVYRTPTSIGSRMLPAGSGGADPADAGRCAFAGPAEGTSTASPVRPDDARVALGDCPSGADAPAVASRPVSDDVDATFVLPHAGDSATANSAAQIPRRRM
jgi:hypothetical protein